MLSRGSRRSGAWSVVLLSVLSTTAACGDGILKLGDEWTAVVRAVTTGDDLDTDGYVVVPDRGRPVVVRTPDDRTFLKLEDGDHLLELTGVAENCAVIGRNPLPVTTRRGEVASVSFHVRCAPIGSR